MTIHKRFSYIAACSCSLGLLQLLHGRPLRRCPLNVSKPCVALLYVYGLHSCPSFPTAAPVHWPTPLCFASFVWSKLQALYNLFFLTEELSAHCKEFKLQQKYKFHGFTLVWPDCKQRLWHSVFRQMWTLRLTLQWSCDMEQHISRLCMIMKLQFTLLTFFLTIWLWSQSCGLQRKVFLFCFDFQDIVAVVSVIPIRCAQNSPFSLTKLPQH